ncbi:hypothetical protein BD309DRAFT_923961 [Dichomitus squalens]|uniref:Uncharacterized protein n=2 Tax=Dichomitus squalens TaxID=114155 RepID=A0A4Q9NNH2_9APHY|nr:uncharacterized protein DICSQDRAFT_157873 [Dichomitus squalens LYAD-421 SS1]EJF56578.1 hypothetical protein DICSQDRAFT_157873 [Dichomitus squalens LYAD-421 SS1]TBU29443.1 hypothetical protein BD311DRAFT_720634 [Dichomitus squalens]TBU42225.1 hypothetical protein BD309DRAFT_923961 [Dichomitus squalens]
MLSRLEHLEVDQPWLEPQFNMDDHESARGGHVIGGFPVYTRAEFSHGALLMKEPRRLASDHWHFPLRHTPRQSRTNVPGPCIRLTRPVS